MSPAELEEAIDRVLPQTQCTKCGYPACRPYARAIATGEAALNRCPPGGEAGIRALAALTGRPYVPLDPACGVEQPRRVALVDEARCIGCTLCIAACPADAIVGARKHMHTVITELCTGCDLCLPPCPVDCIEMVPAADASWTRDLADAARDRYRRRVARLARDKAARAAARAQRGASSRHGPAAKRAAIEAALERARARRAADRKR
jgi:electron transport complex protein RnfB